MGEFRLYNKLNCSIFDLIGDKEPDQTKGLGYLLYYSPEAMNLFLNLVYPGEKKRIKDLLESKWIIDCELIQKTGDKTSKRSDIVIRFFDGINPKEAIVVEAKSVKGQIGNVGAITQVEGYKKLFEPLTYFGTITLVTLTTVVQIVNTSVKAITWQGIRDVFSSATEPMIQEYLNYINKIKGVMKFYNKEILSINASRTINYVKDKDIAIWECPNNPNDPKKRSYITYKTRAESKPLYFAYRDHGRIEYLFKILDVVSLNLDDDSAIDVLDKMGKYPNIKKRLEKYKKESHATGTKFVFIIDLDESIELPFPVQYDNSSRAPQGDVYLSLKEVFGKPVNGTVFIANKSSKRMMAKSSPRTLSTR